MNTRLTSKPAVAAAAALALVFGLAAADARATIMLTPSGASATTNDNSNLTALLDINSAFGTSYAGLSLLYKANSGTIVTEDGTLAAFYTTVFSNTSTDPADADITWDGGASYIACPTCILIVKDGNQEPAQYLFDLGSWSGQEAIALRDFWPNSGAISNVAIWGGGAGNGDDGGTPPSQIPEPGVLMLLGAGLLGLGLGRRRQTA